MIPILYEKTETAFTSDGIGRLVDCIKCTVTEERNGVYTCEFEYPVTGLHYSDITEGRIVGCAHDDSGDIQPFDICGRTEPINGVITFRANHVSYRQNEIVVAPYTASSVASAIANIKASASTLNPFTYWTDVVSATPFINTAPVAAMSLLGGQEGSLLDTYGGEYEFDKFTVKLWAHRGEDTDVTVQYAKNLIDYEREVDFSGVYNGFVPYWTGMDEESDADLQVIGDPVKADQTLFNGRDIYVPLDLSDQFEEKPTKADLENFAAEHLTATQPWLPDQNITVNFVALWQVEEYKQLAPVAALRLCDRANIVVPMYGLTGTMKVVKTVFNVLADRYDEIELGKPQVTLAQTITQKTEEKVEKVAQSTRRVSQIAGNTNQYFWHTQSGEDTGAHITEIPKAEFLVDPENGGSNLLARSNGIAMRDGTDELAVFSSSGIYMNDGVGREIFSVDARSGDITHILRYGYPSSDGYGGVINLGRAINTFTSISVTYYGIADTPADAVTETWNSLPVAVHISDTEEYGFYVEQVNSSTLDINFFSVDADGFGSLIVDNFTINYTTTQITTEVDVGAYPDTTLTAPLRIGNGTANNAKSNAFIVDWAGNGLFAGNDIRYGCNADSSGGKSLIHGDMINGYYYVAQDDSEYVFDVYRIGHIVTVLCQCTKTASVSAGGIIFTGVVNGSYGRIPKPAMDYATGAGFYNSCVIGAFMYPDDDYLRITIRNITGGTLPAGATVYVSLTYATNE